MSEADESRITIFGIVTDEYTAHSGTSYYVWTKHSFPGRDGILTPVSNQSKLEIGQWVLIRFTRQEVETYFPFPKNAEAPRFKSNDYRVIQFHPTLVHLNSIYARFDHYLTDDQSIIEHPSFGIIYCIGTKTTRGIWNVIIKRLAPDELEKHDFMESVWVLDHVSPPSPKPVEPYRTVTGIVVSHHQGGMYIWCRETAVGKDIRIVGRTDFPVTTWVTIGIHEALAVRFFHPACTENLTLRDGGATPMYNSIQKTRAVHETNRLGNAVGLRLRCFIAEETQDIPHPFFGLILNSKHIAHTGLYDIAVKRGLASVARDGMTRSVWNLASYQLIRTIPFPQPVPQVERLRIRPPEVPQAKPPVVANQTVAVAIITNIQKTNDVWKEAVYCWMIKEHKMARLHLSTQLADDFDLRPGRSFRAMFTENENGCTARPPLKDVHDLFETKTIGTDVCFRIYAEALETGNRTHPTIYHDDFGDVVDNFRRLKPNKGIKYHMWIRRAFVKELSEICWVVVESIDL